MLDEIALGGVERLARGLGKGPALRVLLTMRESSAGAARAALSLRAIQLAAELADEETLSRLVTEWPIEDGAIHGDVRRAVGSLLAGGHVAGAARLADAERERCAGGDDEAGAHYLIGRCRERDGDHAGAAEAFRRVGRTSDRQPRLERAAMVRAARASALAGDPVGAARAAGELIKSGLDDVAPADRLALAVLALAASGRYRRAAALDVLERLAARGPASLRPVAVARAARFAEQAGGALSDIERDRVAAVLTHHGDGEAREHALARLEAMAALSAGHVEGGARASAASPVSRRASRRAYAVLEDKAPGPRPAGDGRELIGWLALEAIHRARVGHRRDALHALEELCSRVEEGARAEAAAWTAAREGLRVHPRVARRLVRALAAADGEPPPRGYGGLAAALLAIGAADEAIGLLRRAAMRREPDARRQLADHLRAAGWAAAAEGRRERALEHLREARALYRGETL